MKRKETIKLAFTILLLFGTITATLLAQRVQNIQKRAQGSAVLPYCKNLSPKNVTSEKCIMMPIYNENFKIGDLDTFCAETTNNNGSVTTLYKLCCNPKSGKVIKINSKGQSRCCLPEQILDESNNCVSNPTPGTTSGDKDKDTLLRACGISQDSYPNCNSIPSTISGIDKNGQAENVSGGHGKMCRIDGTIGKPPNTTNTFFYLVCCENDYIPDNNLSCISVKTGSGGGGGGGGTRPTPTTPPVVNGCPAGGSVCTGGGAWCAGPSRNYSGGCPPSYTMVENSWCSNGYCCCPPGGGGGGGGGGGTQPTTPPSSTGKATPRPTATARDSNQPKITIVFRQQGITSTVKSGISSQLKTYIVLKNSQNTYRIEKVTPSVANGKWIAAFSKDDSGKTIPAGVYSLSIKGNSHLRKKFEGVEIGNGNVTIDKSTKDEEQLKAGDVNGDNTITIEDQSIVLKYYTDFRVKVKPSNSEMINADINKDGYITIDDVALVALNWSSITVPGDNE